MKKVFTGQKEIKTRPDDAMETAQEEPDQKVTR
jgi:hypothetical protein